MLILDPAYVKLIKIRNKKRIKVNNQELTIIPEGIFSDEEIEQLKEIENWRISLGYLPGIANFLPDDVRPEGVKKL